MINEKIEKTVKGIISSLFNVEESNIINSSSPETIQEWDSLGQMNLVMSLEEEFGISFTDNQVIEMVNFELICLTVKEVLDSQ